MSSPNLVLSLGIGPQISPMPSPNPDPEMSSPSLTLSLCIGPQTSPPPTPNPARSPPSPTPDPEMTSSNSTPDPVLCLGIGPQIGPTPSPNQDPNSSSQAPATPVPDEEDDPSLALTLAPPRRSPRRRHHGSSSPLEDEDLLREILVRLPPQPSLLPRASLVSKHWLRTASDPRFTRSFRLRHRLNPPLLGFFAFNCPPVSLELVPTLDPPNRVPDYCWHLDLPFQSLVLGNRHGLVLVSCMHQLVVLDPANGHQQRFDLPLGFLPVLGRSIHGAVLRASDNDDDLQVVLVGSDMNKIDAPVVAACVYSSKKRAWGKLVSTSLPPEIPSCYLPLGVERKPAILVGDCLYWKLTHHPAILEFALSTQNLGVIALPDYGPGDFTVMRAEGGDLGLLILSTGDVTCTLQYWKRETDSRGVDWVLGRTVDLDELIPQLVMVESDDPDEDDLEILGYAESNNVVFLRRFPYLYMLQLDTLKFKEVETYTCCCHPFESVYTGIGGNQDGAEVLRDWEEELRGNVMS